MNTKKLFRHIKDTLVKLLRGAGKAVLDNADEAIAISNHIKGYVNSPLYGNVSTLIPGEFSKAVIEEATAILDKIMPLLIDVHLCSPLPAGRERHTCYIQKIKELTPYMQNAFLLKLASAYLIEKHPELMEHEADSIIQARYIESK